MPATIDSMTKTLSDMTDSIATELSIENMPSVNKSITAQNFYTTKNYQATTEVIRQPEEVTIQLDKYVLGKVMVPVLDAQQRIAGGKLG